MREATKKILVVEDERPVRTLLYRHLTHKKYDVEAVESGSLAMSMIEKFEPELVILDVNLPDINGLELCRSIQKRTNSLILFLTNSVDLEDRLRGFSCGADEYMTKPFDLDELLMRIQALFKRSRSPYQASQLPLTFDQLIIDPVRCEVTLDGTIVYLTALEFRLLHCMAKQHGRVWSRAELLKEVWGYESGGEDRVVGGEDRVVDVHIGQIRRKLERDPAHPQFIHTVRGIGYKFEAPTSNLQIPT